MQDSLYQQLEKVRAFSNTPISIELPSGRFGIIPGHQSLLVVPTQIIPTKTFFDKINLGRPDNNTWFLDEKHFYDIVETPSTPYVLFGVDITNWQHPKIQENYNFASRRPLTFHEVINLAFQFPELFNEEISGIQAYGSRFSKSTNHTPMTDDTLEIYRKGDPGNGFLKLAREFHRYFERSKIIPLSLE